MLRVNIQWLHVLNLTCLCKYLKQMYIFSLSIKLHEIIVLFIISLSPHKCPDPKPRNTMCTNFAMRFSNNIHSRKLNQRLIHSRFCPTRMFHMSDEEAYFTCVEYLVSFNNIN